jgi:hypothetical protein
LDTGRIEILAYFSVAMDHLLIREGVSGTLRRKLNGIFNDDRVPCYLIGQLARNDSCPKEVLDGEEILNYALSVLLDAHDIIGGRFVRVDSKECVGLLSFYQSNGFRLLPDKEEHGLCQLVRFISSKKQGAATGIS